MAALSVADLFQSLESEMGAVSHAGTPSTERRSADADKARSANPKATAQQKPEEGSVPGAVRRDRSKFACASGGCSFMVHSRPEIGGYCCIACSQSGGGEHGPRCEQVRAAPEAPRAEASWAPLSGERLATLELEQAQRLLAEGGAGAGAESEVLPGGAVCFRHFLEVPLRHGGGEPGRRLRLFFREVLLAAHLARRASLPALLCLNGGPGFPAARPHNVNAGWLGSALRGHRVVLLDQRGTGLSTPATAQTLRGMSAEEQAAYLVHFRADAIAEDCEAVRRALGVKKISILGEYFGGFVALTYLSRRPLSLSAVYITGGLAPVTASGPDEVHRRLYQRAIARSRRYYARYPGDVARVREIVAHLERRGGEPLPGGGRLTPRRFLSLGRMMTGGFGFESMHDLVESAFVNIGSEKVLDFRFLRRVEMTQSFDEHPLCWLLHEAMYCGPSTGASSWSAHRLLSQSPMREVLDYRAALENPAEPPILFTGEMVYPWFDEDFASLGQFAGTARLLADKVDWPLLYDLKVLQNVRVPVAVVVDRDDLCMDLEVSKSTAALLGAKCKLWSSELFSRYGLAVAVLDNLFTMAKNEKLWKGVAECLEGPEDVPDGASQEDLELAEARIPLELVTDWPSVFSAWRRRVRSGLDEDLLKGGAFFTARRIHVPLDHTRDPAGPTIQIFFREIVNAPQVRQREKLPALLFLTGGPGFAPSRPLTATDGWLGSALRDHRVVLLDMRGTGRSAPITAQTLRGMAADAQASYLAHFRADSIVEDCEAVRRALGLAKLSLLGESFGGFCALAYSSRHPASLDAVYITGGLAPVLATGPDEVYRCTYERVLARNRLYYERYPADAAKVRDVVAHLEAKGGVQLPGGGRLTPRRFLSLGLMLGHGFGLEKMHVLLEQAFVLVGAERELDVRFLKQVEAAHSFETSPLYWLLHEPMYCGPNSGACRWSAERVMREHPFADLFDYRTALKDPNEPPILFTGEMVYSWFAEDFAQLGAIAEAAEMLAAKSDWTALYDIDALRGTPVPIAAHVDTQDIYVDVELSRATAELLGDRCSLWISDEFQHSGLCDSGGSVLDRLMEMAKAKANT